MQISLYKSTVLSYQHLSCPKLTNERKNGIKYIPISSTTEQKLTINFFPSLKMLPFSLIFSEFLHFKQLLVLLNRLEYKPQTQSNFSKVTKKHNRWKQILSLSSKKITHTTQHISVQTLCWCKPFSNIFRSYKRKLTRKSTFLWENENSRVENIF